jgi:cell fate regulator YaaT (PSP1 superfamily)
MHVYDWLADHGPQSDAPLYEVFEVRFKGGRTGYYHADGADVQTGDQVVVEAERGKDLGTVHLAGELVRLRLRSKGIEEDARFPAIVRRATLGDLERWESNKEDEAETFLVGRRAIDRMNLPMKLVDVEWQFDRAKVTFYFTAEHRVDFRQLVRELARRFRTRVELRQIGARDEAARIGGIGSCGRELCCSTWLQEFKPVSTSAAKMQRLPLNPTRLSGQCGRLKCCLNYELEQYMEALRHFPATGTYVPAQPARGAGQSATPGGTIRKVDIFRERVALYTDEGDWADLSLEAVRRALGMVEGELLDRSLSEQASRAAPPPRRGHRRSGSRR